LSWSSASGSISSRVRERASARRCAIPSLVIASATAMQQGYSPAIPANVNGSRPPPLSCRPMEIEGASALVCGGASGLGEATVRRLHDAGASVVISDLNPDRGAALAEELGERARFVEANVMEAEGVQAAVDAAAEHEGGLRISICCAGIGWAQRTTSKQGPHDLEVFHNVIKVNLIGTFNVLRLAATAMSENDADDEGERGVCLNTASIAAYDGQIGQVAYAASKGGIVGLTLPAARDLAGRGIRVVTIAPGLFDTPLLAALPEEQRQALGAGIPFPSRLGRPDEYADLVEHVVHNTMLNGETIRLDGALRMPPK
jgi:NAD(P)-dependent dehydrogenase (short-subunit alcohol dehydrogenase family)